MKIISSQRISIRQEMDLLNAYIEIIKIRFEDRLAVVCQIDPELEALPIPPATIQPLVENSIQHGLRSRTAGGVIRIELKKNWRARGDLRRG